MKKIQFLILTKSIGFYLNLLSFIKPEKAKQIAYQLFSQPRKGKLNPNQLPKTLINTEKETFQHEDHTFQTYIWKGNDEIILLVHGWESNASRWKKMLNHLKPLGKTIIAIDAPAHGLTTGKEFNAPKYAEYINTLTKKYSPKIIIGHSVGGAAISYYLHKFGNPNIEKVVLLGAPSDFKIISNNFVSMLSLNKKIKNRLENYYQEKFNIHIDEFKAHNFAQNFSQKAFIAHDIDDKIVLVEEGKKYASNWKNAIYIETKGLGHSLHDHDLYQKISQFIQEA
ncbi:alpha/beta hydrolase [Flavobacterium macrobrachii]|uniref:Alpha/beta hydrolase n=1 Tax=Flavobacterium macrobrachii TaxID=591204 RepID=A0ABS2CU49_9FLAO|nr:alpha/beta hydrolase [Flavobacterium macrobrachii]MBM6498499.1 alpha/beta hydrolase [Flavobacterium macrobrachii]PZO29580.1 MAG: alpha/beta hydrolase [Flavobacteriaceae bacterium]